jgi:hypothetical protein
MGTENLGVNGIASTLDAGVFMLEGDAVNIEYKLNQIRQAVHGGDATQALRLLEILRLQMAESVYHAAYLVKEAGGEPLIVLRDAWYQFQQPHRGDWLPTFNTTDRALLGSETRKREVNEAVVRAMFHLYSPDEADEPLHKALFTVDDGIVSDEALAFEDREEQESDDAEPEA